MTSPDWPAGQLEPDRPVRPLARPAPEPDPADLRVEIADAAHDVVGCDDDTFWSANPTCWRLANAVLALPRVRALLAAEEKLARVEALAAELERGYVGLGTEWGRGANYGLTMTADSIRRALDGDS